MRRTERWFAVGMNGDGVESVLMEMISGFLNGREWWMEMKRNRFPSEKREAKNKMFRGLHRKMTFFCSAVTGAILLGLSAVCLLFAEKSIVQAGYTAFQKELGSVLTSLQSQEYISHQWLRQMQAQHHFTMFLYDNGEPLYYERLQEEPQEELVRAVLERVNWDIFGSRDGYSSWHEEFPLSLSGKRRYYASAGYLTRGRGQVSFVILYDNTHQARQLARLAILIAGADLLTLLLLVFFSWFFTGRMLVPLEDSQKRQQQFVASASHELRSPLAVMLSGLESAQKAEDEGERQHFYSMIRQEGLRMQHLIADMLLLANTDARGMALHPDWLQPDDLLLSVYEKYEPIARAKGIALQLVVPEGDAGECRADGERVTQLLSILVDNAVSYTPAGGRILLLLAQDGNETVFAVADNGPSIPDGEKEHIFERFYRADVSHTDHGHFGLGLCTAQEIAKAHHGRLVVRDLDSGLLPESFPRGSGVMFCFYLRNCK